MKFICENCKAKYQIGDDKIAGRSVRMKCRRCGHLIQLNATVTDASSHPEGAGTDLETSFVETGSSASRPLAAMIGAQGHDAMSQLREEPEDDPTRAMTREQRAALGVKEPQAPAPHAAGLPGARAAAPAPHVGAPAPGAARPAFGASAPAAGGIAARGAIPAPGAARPLGGTGAPGIARPAPAAAPAAGAARPLGVARPPGGVAGAFQKTLAEGTAPSDPPKTPASHVPHGEDWYVGVGGVPLGPVRLAVIREKAIAGAVHAESLVWREGFDEWQPLKNFPELLQIVEEAQAARGGGRRPSAVPPRAVGPTAPGAVHAPAAPKPGVAAPSPYQAKAPAPAGYQPKVTQLGMGIPAVSLPAAGKLPVTAPAPVTAPKPAQARSALTPPAPSGRSSAVPSEPTRPSDVGAPPEARTSAPHAPAAVPHGRHDVAPHSATAISPMPTPAPAPAASFDLFGGVSPPTPAPAPAPVVPAPAPTPVPAPAAVVAPAPAPTPLPALAAPLPSPAGVADPVTTGVAASSALDVMKDPFAAPSAAPAASAAKPSGRASLPSIDTGAPSPPSEAPLSIPGLEPRRRGGMHPVVYAFIAMAAAFGGVFAYLMFSRPPQQIIVYQPMPGSSTGAPVSGTAAPADSASAAPVGTDSPAADPSSQPRAQGGGSSGGGASTKPTSSGTSAPLDTSGFGNQVVPPPVATPTSTGADPSLGQLSQGEIQGVVAANQARVKKRCWQPALDAAGANASPNARVQGKIVIGPSGSVDSASASGAEKDYPGLSSCIAGQMKGWKFPPSGGSTPVNVPFVFAGQ